MKNLAIFDLDNTLINTDSDHSWPQYLIKKGLVDAAETEAQNEKFYRDYQNGCLDIDAFLKFSPRSPITAKKSWQNFTANLWRSSSRPTSRPCSVCWCRATKCPATKPS